MSELSFIDDVKFFTLHSWICFRNIQFIWYKPEERLIIVEKLCFDNCTLKIKLYKFIKTFKILLTNPGQILQTESKNTKIKLQI